MVLLKIFISSPGDVGREREITHGVIARLQGEFAARAKLEPYFWEHEPMLANVGDYAQNIPAPGDFDIFVCLLWSRLGTRLHSRHRTREGQEFPSGTVYEFENARANAARTRSTERPAGTPDMLTFIKTARPDIELTPEAIRKLKLDQYDALQAWIQNAFLDHEQGTFNVATNMFQRLDQFELLVEKGLRRCIQERLPKDSQAAQLPPATWLEAPFLGLRHYDMVDAPVFFGRTAAIDEVLTQWRRHALDGCAFCLVFGSSGIGKSSLARAGVLPLLLKPGTIENVGLWRYAILQPRDGEAAGKNLFLALARALLRPEALPELAADGTTDAQLADRLSRTPEGVDMLIKGALSQTADAVRRRLGLDEQPTARLALLIDQTEELFTLDWVGTATRDAFVAALGTLARSGQVWVLGTLRSDYFARCEEVAELMTLKTGDGAYHLRPPEPYEIGQMIRWPALAGGLRFEEDPDTADRLDEMLRDDALRSREALPLLSFALERLYERRDPSRQMLQLSSYRDMGGLEGALREQAEGCYAEFSQAFPQGHQQAFDQIMRLLVHQPVGDSGTAAARSWAALTAFRSDEVANTFVRSCIQARLFITETTASGEAAVSLAHEALLRAWPRLAAWVRDNADFLQRRARVTQARHRWEQTRERADPPDAPPGRAAQAGHDDSLLLPVGLPLSEGEQLLKSDRTALPPEDIAFIERSSRVARAGERRRNRVRWAVLTVISALALAAGGMAFKATMNARRAERARADADDLSDFMLRDLPARLAALGRVDVLDSVAAKTQSYLAGLKAQPDSPARRVQAVRLGFNLGRVRLAQGRLRDALDVLRETARQAEAAPSSEPEFRLALADVYDALCDTLARTVEISEEQRDSGQAIALYRPLAAGDGSLSVEARLGLASALLNLGDLQRQVRAYGAARKSYAESLTIADGLAQAVPDVKSRLLELRALLRNGDIAQAQGNRDEARAFFEKRLALGQQLAAAEPGNLRWSEQTALSHDRLAEFYLTAARLEPARQNADAALQLLRDLAEHDRTNMEWQRLLATAWNRRGSIRLAAGRAGDALGDFREGLAINETLVKVAPANLGWQRGLATSHSLVSEALASDDLNAALDEAGRAFEIRRRLHADPAGSLDAEITRDLVVSLNKTASLFYEAGRMEDAQPLAEEAVQVARGLVASGDSTPGARADLATSIESLAEMRVARSQQTEGLKLYGEALGFREQLAHDFPTEAVFQRNLANCHELIGGLLKDRGETSAARAEYESARTLRQRLAAGRDNPPAWQQELIECEAALRDLEGK